MVGVILNLWTDQCSRYQQNYEEIVVDGDLGGGCWGWKIQEENSSKEFSQSLIHGVVYKSRSRNKKFNFQHLFGTTECTNSCNFVTNHIERPTSFQWITIAK